MEAAELAIFMISACVVTVVLFHPASPVPGWLPSAALRRLLMGAGMGGTAVGIILCPWGKRSGAHFNPAVTLSFFRLGKIGGQDAFWYVVFQFLGGIGGVGVSVLLLGGLLAAPSVHYVVTVPGPLGAGAAWAAEWLMAALMMAVVLGTSTRPRLAQWTPYSMGVLIMLYVLVFAPVSGFSINPARTVGSAVWAQVWTAVWVYFTAPVLGMGMVAEGYVRVVGLRKRYFTHRHVVHRGGESAGSVR